MALLSDYTAGTVTVAANGTAVTGVGTGWLAANFREGDWFIASGYATIIASVNSNTSITLAQPYRGAALSGAAYRLRYASDGSRTSAQARQLIDLLGGSGNLEAFSGLVGVAGRVPVFTGPGTMALQDFSTVGTVTSVGVSVPTGFAASAPITTNGTIAITYSSGYEGFTTALKDLVNNSLGPGTNLAAIAAISATGHLVRTAAGTFATRTITGTANQITVANGNGVSGNPTLSLPVAVTTSLGRADTALQASNFASNSDIDTGTSTTTIVNPAGARRAAQTHTPATRASFRAHKNGVAQASIASATATVVSFPTAAVNVGNYFNTSNSRWTPPAGTIQLTAIVRVTAGVVAGADFYMSILKNGTTYIAEMLVRPQSTSQLSIPAIVLIDTANGTDYYDVRVTLAGTGTKTIGGDENWTYFAGTMI